MPSDSAAVAAAALNDHDDDSNSNSSAMSSDGMDNATFVDFAPRVFQKLRQMHGISEDEYRYMIMYIYVTHTK